jgi:hypothetical protein
MFWDLEIQSMVKKRKSNKATNSVRGYNTWTKDDLKELRRHSKERTPVADIAGDMGRSEATIRMKAYSLGMSVGHRRRKAKKARR